jgi:hypothetical protein
LLSELDPRAFHLATAPPPYLVACLVYSFAATATSFSYRAAHSDPPSCCIAYIATKSNQQRWPTAAPIPTGAGGERLSSLYSFACGRRPSVADDDPGSRIGGPGFSRVVSTPEQQLHLHDQVQRGNLLAQVPFRTVPPGRQYLLPRLHQARPLRLLHRHRAARHRHPRHHAQGGHRGLEEVPAGP